MGGAPFDGDFDAAVVEVAFGHIAEVANGPGELGGDLAGEVTNGDDFGGAAGHESGAGSVQVFGGAADAGGADDLRACGDVEQGRLFGGQRDGQAQEHSCDPHGV